MSFAAENQVWTNILAATSMNHENPSAVWYQLALNVAMHKSYIDV